MAKCTIIIEDEEIGPRVRVEFTPPLKRGEPMTPAQELGVEFTQALADHPDRETITVKP